jgi:hypothetical protein
MGLPNNGELENVLPHPIPGWICSAIASLECQPCLDAQKEIQKWLRKTSEEQGKI